MKNRRSGFSGAARRERAEAQGRAAKAALATKSARASNPATGAKAAPAGTTRRPIRRSPLALLMGGVVVVAVIAAAALLVQPKNGPVGPATPGSSTAAGILVPLNETPVNLAFGRFLGRPDAPVHLIVWSDFQCAACRTFAETTQPQLIRDYVTAGKLRIEFRDLAVVGIESSAAAAAARCADQQNAFWPSHDVLFANQVAVDSGQLGPKRLKDMADAIGLDRTKFGTCLPSADLFNQIQTETRLGKIRGSTPPVLDFGPVVMEGSSPYTQLTQTIDTLIATVPTPAPATSAGPSASP